MFTKKMIIDIVKSDLSIIPGINTKKDVEVEIQDKLIKIRLKISKDVNVIETSKRIVSQLRYKLVDKSDEKDFAIELILKK